MLRLTCARILTANTENNNRFVRPLSFLVYDSRLAKTDFFSLPKIDSLSAHGTGRHLCAVTVGTTPVYVGLV